MSTTSTPSPSPPMPAPPVFSAAPSYAASLASALMAVEEAKLRARQREAATANRRGRP